MSAYQIALSLHPNYSRLDSVQAFDSQSMAAYDIRVHKGDAYAIFVLDYRAASEVNVVWDMFTVCSARVLMRDTIGFDVMMLDMDADHGNGD